MDVQHIAAPEAGKDYPCNWNEFLDRFASEEACLAYLEGCAGRKDSFASRAALQRSLTAPAVRA